MESNTNKKRISSFILVVTFLLIVIMAARTPLDADMWWHLRAGEDTVRSGIPVTVDAYSFSRLNSAWTNHSWLSQVIMYLIFNLSGYTGLSVFMAVCAVLSMWVVSIQMPPKPVLRSLMLVFGGIVASVNWVPRPQIISLILLALTGWILQRYLRKPGRWIWILPGIFMMWGNLHGGYSLGLILIGCFSAGSILANVIGMNPLLNWRQILTLIAATGVGYLFTAINPNGLRTLVIPFQTVFMEGNNLILEWASPDFHDPLQLIFLIYFILLIWALTYAKKTVHIEYLISISVFAYMAFAARRNIGPCIIVTLPILAGLIDSIPIPQNISDRIQKWRSGSAEKPISNTLRISVNSVIIVLLVLAAAIKTYTVTQGDLVNQFIRQYYPLDAVEWIMENSKPQRVMNEYNWGGFLIWKLRDYPVFIDGRTDLFGDEIINQWLEVMDCGDQSKQILEKWDAHLLLVYNGRPIIQCAVDDGWQIVFKDDKAVVLTNNPALSK